MTRRAPAAVAEPADAAPPAAVAAGAAAGGDDGGVGARRATAPAATSTSHAQVTAVDANEFAFAAITQGGVIAWGDAQYGGDIHPPTAAEHDIVGLYHTTGAFAAHRRDKSVAARGDPRCAPAALPPSATAPHPPTPIPHHPHHPPPFPSPQLRRRRCAWA